MRKTLIGRTVEPIVTGIHGAAAQAASFAAIAVAVLLVPSIAKGQEESMPTTNDGERAITARIAGVPVIPRGFALVEPDYREYVRHDSFVSNGTESLESWGISHYVMISQMTVTYLDDCAWMLSYREQFDPRALARESAKALAAAAADIDLSGLEQGTVRLEDAIGLEQLFPGYHDSEEGTQAVLSGEIVFQQMECGWRVAGIRDSAFGWKESATEASDSGSWGP